MSLGNKEIMAKNIKRYMALKNVTATAICDALHFKTNTFSDWVNAKTYPRIDKIEMMANYFGLSKSDLIEDKTESINNLTNLEKQIILAFRKSAHQDAILSLLGIEKSI